jgi:hypothetical protein
LAAYNDAVVLEPENAFSQAFRGVAFYGRGDFEHARASCEAKPQPQYSESALVKLETARGDADAYLYATIYAQWGDATKALELLEIAVRLADSSLAYLKTDPLMDPLRKAPRFQAIERELNFPK